MTIKMMMMMMVVVMMAMVMVDGVGDVGGCGVDDSEHSAEASWQNHPWEIQNLGTLHQGLLLHDLVLLVC